MESALPVVSLAGRNWTVDERLNELRAVDRPSDVLTGAEACQVFLVERAAMNWGGE